MDTDGVGVIQVAAVESLNWRNFRVRGARGMLGGQWNS